MFPQLKRPTCAVGKFILIPGSFWNGCPASDTRKQLRCIVMEFIAMHDFGGGRKGAAYSVKEMGETGVGSLEPGIASGDEFLVGYPTPFLEYFYEENADMLPAHMRPAVSVLEGCVVKGCVNSPAAEGSADSPPVVMPKDLDGQTSPSRTFPCSS